MRILLSKNFYSSMLSVANPNPVKWDYTYVLSAIAELGIEMPVDTRFMFKTEFNVNLPKEENARVLEYIFAKHKNVKREELTEYVNKNTGFRVELGKVDKIINDERDLYFRCGYTGKLIPTNKAEGYEHASYLENIDYAPEKMRLWRLKNVETGIVNDYTTEQVKVELAKYGKSVEKQPLRQAIIGKFALVDE